MALPAGEKLGPYEILSPLGAGGMGEVYKAWDTRLDRSVAVKVLPDHIAAREDARTRFEREARAVASLNHPNICVLYDIGPNYMVMELIEGETLAARIERGAIPLDQAIKLAIQIADALDRAHRAGVTHRDVKPHNIMLTRDGVKVLDFGLAKSAPTAPGPTEATMTKVLTTEGTVLGTPQYMAPEQFEGKEADARSDIWAFGAVLYEMVTGQKAFQGKNYTSLVAAILGGEPAPMAVKPFTPRWLERLVKRCLEKEADDRYQSMRDLVIDLKSPAAEVALTPAKSSRWWQAATAASILAAVVFAGLWLRRTTPPALPVATEIAPPQGTTFTEIGQGGGSAISPDGRVLAFFANNEKREDLLYVRPLESLAARALAGAEGAGRPFWSPDGKSLAFFGQRKLKRIDMAGGTPVDLCDVRDPRGGDWNPDGVVLFGTLQGIWRIAASGGSPVLLTRVNREAGETRHYYPQFLPGGREFLYLVHNEDGSKSGIALGSLDGKTSETGPAAIVVHTQYSARYDGASSSLLYMQERGTLLARRLESHPARLVGDPVMVAQGVRSAPSNGYAEFSLSRQGSLFYGRGAERPLVRFGWRDRSGKLSETIGEPLQAGSFSLSPDGTRVAYTGGTGSRVGEVWVMDLARGLSTRVSFTNTAGSISGTPLWSPDGKFLYYNSPKGIVRKSADGLGEEVLLGKFRPDERLFTVSPDGASLLFGTSDILKLPLAAAGPGNAKPEEYLKTEVGIVNAAFSPDGRWVAYQSSESGRGEIYMQGYPDKRGKWRISDSGGRSVAWRSDGRELYWSRQDGTVMAAEIELQREAVRPGRAQPLFELPDARRFQPSRDGKRFLVLERASPDLQNESMVLLQNWAAKLEK